MRILKRVAALLSLALGAFALAQAPAVGPPPQERISEIPNPEKVRRSAEALVRIRSVLKEVLVKHEEARASRDVIKLTCVNEKLTQVKGLLKITEQSDVSMQEAMAKLESTSVDHEFTKVTIARQKVEQLRAEAEECIGQLAFRTDEGAIVEVVTPDLPSVDEAAPDLISTRPPPASPTL